MSRSVAPHGLWYRASSQPFASVSRSLVPKFVPESGVPQSQLIPPEKVVCPTAV